MEVFFVLLIGVGFSLFATAADEIIRFIDKHPAIILMPLLFLFAALALIYAQPHIDVVVTLK